MKYVMLCEEVELVHVTTEDRLGSILETGIRPSAFGDMAVGEDDGAGVYAVRNDARLIQKVLNDVVDTETLGHVYGTAIYDPIRVESNHRTAVSLIADVGNGTISVEAIDPCEKGLHTEVFVSVQDKDGSNTQDLAYIGQTYERNEDKSSDGDGGKRQLRQSCAVAVRFREDSAVYAQGWYSRQKPEHLCQRLPLHPQPERLLHGPQCPAAGSSGLPVFLRRPRCQWCPCVSAVRAAAGSSGRLSSPAGYASAGSARPHASAAGSAEHDLRPARSQRLL